MASILLANGANATRPEPLTLEAPLHIAVRQKQYQVLNGSPDIPLGLLVMSRRYAGNGVGWKADHAGGGGCQADPLLP